MDDLEDRRRRLRWAHLIIRAELATAFGLALLAALVYVGMPRGPSPMFMGDPPLIETLVPWLGVGMVVVGLVWMIRLSRPDPESGARSWRYRDFD